MPLPHSQSVQAARESESDHRRAPHRIGMWTYYIRQDDVNSRADRPGGLERALFLPHYSQERSERIIVFPVCGRKVERNPRQVEPDFDVRGYTREACLTAGFGNTMQD